MCMHANTNTITFGHAYISLHAIEHLSHWGVRFQVNDEPHISALVQPIDGKACVRIPRPCVTYIISSCHMTWAVGNRTAGAMISFYAGCYLREPAHMLTPHYLLWCIQGTSST